MLKTLAKEVLENGTTDYHADAETQRAAEGVPDNWSAEVHAGASGVGTHMLLACAASRLSDAACIATECAMRSTPWLVPVTRKIHTHAAGDVFTSSRISKPKLVVCRIQPTVMNRR